MRVISRSPSPKAQSEPPRENRRKLLRMMRESQAVYEASQSASTEVRAFLNIRNCNVLVMS